MEGAEKIPLFTNMSKKIGSDYVVKVVFLKNKILQRRSICHR
jgi:hypothetical protein